MFGSFCWSKKILKNQVLLLNSNILLQGTLIKHLEEHILQGNVNQDDILLYYTTVKITLIIVELITFVLRLVG